MHSVGVGGLVNLGSVFGTLRRVRLWDGFCMAWKALSIAMGYILGAATEYFGWLRY